MVLHADISIYNPDTAEIEFRVKRQKLDIALSKLFYYMKNKDKVNTWDLVKKHLKKLDDDLVGIAQDIGQAFGLKK